MSAINKEVNTGMLLVVLKDVTLNVHESEVAPVEEPIEVHNIPEDAHDRTLVE